MSADLPESTTGSPAVQRDVGSNAGFSPDRAISSANEDRLGRSGFARGVANAVAEWTGNDNLVIAVYGPWGHGKSSVKNMVLDDLRRRTSPKTTVVEFNPWQWASQSELTGAFFAEVGSHLAGISDRRAGQLLARQWRKYAALLGVGNTLFDGLKRGSWAILIVLGALSAGGWLIPLALSQIGVALPAYFIGLIHSLQSALGVLFLLSAFGTVVTGWAQGAAKSVSEWLSIWHEANDPEQAKKELSDSLRRLAGPILVVMDDIDRLTPEEIRTLFQVVKANADLPNMVYLLFFDRDLVEKALTTDEVPGRAYLDKIVQVGLNLPAIEEQRFQSCFDHDLGMILAGAKAAQLFDQHRWANLYLGGLRYHLDDLRDLGRLMNAFQFHLKVLSHQGVLNVNPVDLLALEVVRLFEPTVYEAIAHSRELLTSLGEYRDKEAVSAAVQAIVSRAKEGNRNYVSEAIRLLFPPVEYVLGGAQYGHEFYGRWRRDLRVCHPELFDRYFLLAVPQFDVSEYQVQKVISLAADHTALTLELNSLRDRGLLGSLLGTLGLRLGEINPACAETVITSFFDAGDDLPPDVLGPGAVAIGIIEGLLERQQDVKHRAEVLAAAVASTTGLTLPCYLAAMQTAGESRPQEDMLLHEGELAELKAACVEKIRMAARGGTLIDRRHVGFLLGCWNRWVPTGEAREWVTQLVQTTNGPLVFLEAMMYEGFSGASGEHAVRVHKTLDLDAVKRLIDPQELDQRLSQLDALGPEDRANIDTFRRALASVRPKPDAG